MASSPEGIDFDIVFETYLDDRGDPFEGVSSDKYDQYMELLKERGEPETSAIRDEVNGPHHWKNSLNKKPAIYDILDDIAEQIKEENDEEDSDDGGNAATGAALVGGAAAIGAAASFFRTPETLALGVGFKKLRLAAMSASEAMVAAPIPQTTRVVVDTKAIIEVVSHPTWIAREESAAFGGLSSLLRNSTMGLSKVLATNSDYVLSGQIAKAVRGTPGLLGAASEAVKSNTEIQTIANRLFGVRQAGVQATAGRLFGRVAASAAATEAGLFASIPAGVVSGGLLLGLGIAIYAISQKNKKEEYS